MELEQKTRELSPLESTTLEVAFAQSQRHERARAAIQEEIQKALERLQKLDKEGAEEVARFVGYVNAGAPEGLEIPTDLKGVKIAGESGAIVVRWDAPAAAPPAPEAPEAPPAAPARKFRRRKR